MNKGVFIRLFDYSYAKTYKRKKAGSM